MSWAYNDIDIYLSSSDIGPGDTTIDNKWTPVSDYGILRSRVALTPSTYDGDQIKIMGRDGRPYTTDRSRKNAKIDAEILVVDTWIFKNYHTTVRERADLIMAMLNSAKFMSYKQPGKPADGYFQVYNTTITITDADEKAIVIKVSFEVHPLEWLFAGNASLIFAASQTRTVEIPKQCAVAMPVYDMTGTGTITVNGPNASLAKSDGGRVILDTWKYIARYSPSGNNANLILDGDYEELWLNPGTNIVTNNLTDGMRLYTRMGITR